GRHPRPRRGDGANAEPHPRQGQDSRGSGHVAGARAFALVRFPRGDAAPRRAYRGGRPVRRQHPCRCDGRAAKRDPGDRLVAPAAAHRLAAARLAAGRRSRARRPDHRARGHETRRPLMAPPSLELSPLAGSLAVAVAWLAIGLAGLIPAGNALIARRLAFPAGALAGLVLAGFGLQAIWLPAAQLVLPLGLPDLPFHLRIDALAGFFLTVLGAVAAGITIYAAGYFRRETAGRLALIALQYHVL